MSVVRALLFLERDHLRNQIRAVRREPHRLIVWIPTVAALLAVTFSRGRGLAGSGGDAGTAFGTTTDLTTTVVGLFFVALIATGAALALGGRIAVFRSVSEAVLFVNVGIPPLTTAIWLQVRKLASSFRVLGGALYVLVFASPSHGGLGHLVRTLVVTLVSFAVPTCVQLPAFLIRRTPFAGALRGALWGVVALAGVTALAVFVDGGPTRRFLRAGHVDPGVVVRALLAGDHVAFAVLITVVVALSCSVVVLGRDAIPDLYLASSQAFVERGRRRPGEARAGYAARDSRWAMPAGPFAYIWKDWIAFRRGRGRYRIWLGTLTFFTVIGVGAAFAHSPMSLGTLALVFVMFLVGVAPVTAGSDLANDLSKPLFWLARDSVVIRIAAITFGRAARTGLTLGVAPLGAALFAGDLLLAAISLPLAIALAWSLQAMGTALFAYFPSDVDQRGPIVYLRLLIGIALLGPIALAATFGFLYLRAPGAALAAFATALLEGSLSLAIAAERFERAGGAVYARLGATRS